MHFTPHYAAAMNPSPTAATANIPAKGLLVEAGVPWWLWLLVASLIVLAVLYFSMRRGAEDPR